MREPLGGQPRLALSGGRLRMLRVRVLPFITLVLAALLARAQDTAGLRYTLAYTTTIVTVRAKPFANAQSLGRVGAGVSLRLYTCSAGWCSVAAGHRVGYVLQEYLGAQPTAPRQRPGRG